MVVLLNALLLNSPGI